jgi:hypothetical protein
LAEVAGAAKPYGIVVEHFNDDGAVLITDETGFLKKGVKSAGITRQYREPVSSATIRA